ncbi:MAG: AGE family epimerase/isomerase [Spirochaetes bacterium]|nr:AGE family epimerase/isomerase [Spirochaetota bacterium]
MKKILMSVSVALVLLAGCTKNEPVFRHDSTTVGISNITELKQQCRSILDENIIPFWYPSTIDTVNGGYNLNHDINGVFKGFGSNAGSSSNRYIVVQSRMVWFFSRLVRAGYSKEKYLPAAKHGYDYLRNVMQDKKNGGFYWGVSPSGKPIQPNKHMYGQGFAVYALSEYALASKDPEAKAFVLKVFRQLDEKAHDKVNGGYVEYFTPDWQPITGTNVKNYLGVPNGYKLMNTHLHLMEPFTLLYTLSGDALVRERLQELVMIQSSSVMRKTLGACTDKYLANWKPVDQSNYNRVSYGHDLENVWLVAETCDALGVPNSVLLDAYRYMFDYSLRYGFDTTNGGFFDSGAFNRPADKIQKTWWVQAECMYSALSMYSLTKEKTYLDTFYKTLGWITNYQIDRKHGEWFSDVWPVGTKGKSGVTNNGFVAVGGKANAWKAAYHNGRAIIQTISLLEKLERESNDTKSGK